MSIIYIRRYRVWRLLGVIALALTACSAAAPTKLRDGDILFQTSRSGQSQAIQKATHSPYSHMGVLLYQNSRPYVFEAEGKVRYTPLDEWIRRGEGGHYIVKRLRDSDRLLTKGSISVLRALAAQYEGKPYDATFEWSDDRLYCSELVWKMFHGALGIQIGALQKLGDFDLSVPEVAVKVRQRYGNSVPLDETVISPAVMFESDKLVSILQK